MLLTHRHLTPCTLGPFTQRGTHVVGFGIMGANYFQCPRKEWVEHMHPLPVHPCDKFILRIVSEGPGQIITPGPIYLHIYIHLPLSAPPLARPSCESCVDNIFIIIHDAYPDHCVADPDSGFELMLIPGSGILNPVPSKTCTCI
jgi:hypothetical protein